MPGNGLKAGPNRSASTSDIAIPEPLTTTLRADTTLDGLRLKPSEASPGATRDSIAWLTLSSRTGWTIAPTIGATRERNHPATARVGEGPVVVVDSDVVAPVRLRMRPGRVGSPEGAGLTTSVPVKPMVSVQK